MTKLIELLRGLFNCLSQHLIKDLVFGKICKVDEEFGWARGRALDVCAVASI